MNLVVISNLFYWFKRYFCVLTSSFFWGFFFVNCEINANLTKRRIPTKNVCTYMYQKSVSSSHEKKNTPIAEACPYQLAHERFVLTKQRWVIFLGNVTFSNLYLLAFFSYPNQNINCFNWFFLITIIFLIIKVIFIVYTCLNWHPF